MVQAFSSARNNDAVHQRLTWFLDEQVRQLAHLVERHQSEGKIYPS